MNEIKYPTINKNIILLSLSQAIFVAATIICFAFAGLVGNQLAHNPANATLPIAITGLGTLMFTLPISMLMKKTGRKSGFLIGTIMGVCCGLLGFTAISIKSFFLFCIACGFMGIYQAFAQYYRFAATEITVSQFNSKAIAFVLSGGVVGAITGPSIGTAVYQHFPSEGFAYGYLSVAAISIVGFLVCLFLKLPHKNQTSSIRSDSIKKNNIKLFNKYFITAISNVATAYFLMILLMSATPLCMHMCGYDIRSTDYIIQWHILGMYLPSFFAGYLISKFGLKKIFFAGIGFLIISVIFVFLGKSFIDFTIALISLGIGWNFMYVSSSTLLVSACDENNKALAQGLNETVIFATSTIASYLAGVLLTTMGWQKMAIFAIPFLMLAIIISTRISQNETQSERLGETSG